MILDLKYYLKQKVLRFINHQGLLSFEMKIWWSHLCFVDVFINYDIWLHALNLFFKSAIVCNYLSGIMVKPSQKEETNYSLDSYHDFC